MFRYAYTPETNSVQPGCLEVMFRYKLLVPALTAPARCDFSLYPTVFVIAVGFIVYNKV